MYGGEKTKVDSKEHYKGLDLENVFSRALIENALNFSKASGLHFQTVKEAIKNEERIELIKGEDPNNSARKFETAIIVETFKQKSQ